jgi:hypothetical protein
MGADPERENGMARIEGGIVIGRPVDMVFDYIADQGNEPQCNPRMVRVEKITAEPVGNGTQFCSPVASMGRTAEVLSERTGYDTRVLLASTMMMQRQATGMSTTAPRTPYCPSRERSSRPTSPHSASRRPSTLIPGEWEACVQDAPALARITEGALA